MTLDRKTVSAALQEGITGTANRVVIGLNWTLVEGPSGIGLAHTPARGTEGCRSTPAPGSYTDAPLAELAQMSASDQPFERALGVAACNAHWNRHDLQGSDANGLDLIEDRGERTVVIGRFPGLDTRLPGAAVIERESGPGDHPPSAAPALLAEAEQVLITASTLANGSFFKLAELIPKSAFAVLVGPGTPLCPALLSAGLSALSGLVAVDADALCQVVAEGGAVGALRRHARFVTLPETL